MGLIGLSLGGAVSTEFAKTHGHRAAAVVNMDGGLFGNFPDREVSTPYLMLYSEPNEGTNARLVDEADPRVTTVTISESKHMDFHDIKLLLPALKWLGILGPIELSELLRIKNDRIKSFLDANLAARVSQELGQAESASF